MALYSADPAEPDLRGAPGVATLEDLAAVLAERGQDEEARAALNEAVGQYEGLDAQ